MPWGESIDQRSSDIAEDIISTRDKEVTATIALLLLARFFALMTVIYLPRIVVRAVR